MSKMRNRKQGTEYVFYALFVFYSFEALVHWAIGIPFGPN